MKKPAYLAFANDPRRAPDPHPFFTPPNVMLITYGPSLSMLKTAMERKRTVAEDTVLFRVLPCEVLDPDEEDGRRYLRPIAPRHLAVRGVVDALEFEMHSDTGIELMISLIDRVLRTGPYGQIPWPKGRPIFAFGDKLKLSYDVCTYCGGMVLPGQEFVINSRCDPERIAHYGTTAKKDPHQGEFVIAGLAHELPKLL